MSQKHLWQTCKPPRNDLGLAVHCQWCHPCVLGEPQPSWNLALCAQVEWAQPSWNLAFAKVEWAKWWAQAEVSTSVGPKRTPLHFSPLRFTVFRQKWGLIYIKHFQCSRHCSEIFMDISTFNLHMLCPFDRWGNWGMRKQYGRAGMRP